MSNYCIINARFRKQRTTGVQRVAIEICKRLAVERREANPILMNSGVPGHIWEQCLLPLKTGGHLLWSPCNTGPVAVRRQIVTIHDAAVFDYPQWFSANYVRLYHFIIPRLVRNVVRIVTDSDYSRRRIINIFGVNPERVEVVYPGVSETFVPQSADTIEAIKARFHLSGRRYFATLGTLEPRKNIKLVLNAWTQLNAEFGDDIKLLVIGGNIDGSRVFKTAEKPPNLKNVVFSGYVEDEVLPALLSGALALIYPSLYEGFGLPLLEAMACRTVVVTTKQTSIPEVVADAGLYVDPYDPASLFRTMQILATSPEMRKEYADRGFERAGKFTWEHAAQHMNDILSAH